MEVKRMTVGPIRTNCYIVYKQNSENAVIIDPGDEADIIERKLTELKLNPVVILLTHGHFDHIGAAQTLRNRFGISICAYESEKDILESDKNLGRAFGSPLVLKADKYLKDGEIISFAEINFQVIHTPGHTIGSCCFFISENKILFSGDTMFCHSHGRTDFPTGSQSAIIRSIQDKLLLLPDDVKVYPGHEEETSIGYERSLYDFN